MVDIIAELFDRIAEAQEPVAKEFLEFFLPSVQIEIDPSEKDSVTQVYIRGLIRHHYLPVNI